ncbi:MAG TPA: hypothetical protein VEL31_19545 [Ktedonobacteraceae bacterium]|nr:hypothetical protein [Ktedonobacteraceae bacterium]
MIETTSSQTQGQPAQLLPAATDNTITCTICSAAYIPSPRNQDLLQATSLTLESAFMSMCHFCFRCRRPACPMCWDVVHRVCAACVQEAGLPFRVQVAPLEGTLFPPVTPARSAQSVHNDQQATPFICTRPGLFHIAVPPPHSISAAETIEMPALDSSKQVTQEKQQEQELPASQPVPQANTPARVRTWPKILKTIDHVITVLAVITLLAIAVIVPWAEYSPTVNSLLKQLLQVDIRSEIAYLLHMIRQIHY